MIELFNLSVINHINAMYDDGTEVYLHCTNDSQNGIQFDHENGSIIWAMGINIETNRYTLTEVHCDTDFNPEVDFLTEHITIGHMLERVITTINHLRN